MTKIENNFSESALQKLEQHSQVTKFNLNFEIDACFEQIIKLSFQDFKAVNYKKIADCEIGKIFKAKNQKKYLLTKLNIPNEYQLVTVIDKVIYQTTYTLTELKNKKTEIQLCEKIFIESKVTGLYLMIGILNFNKNFATKAKEFTLTLQAELKKC